MTYTIEKITALIGARRYAGGEYSIGWLLTDSRSLCFPELTLFFAIRTSRGDGHNYIPELYRRGVRNFVVEIVPKDYAKRFPHTNFLKVMNPLEALQRLSERHRDEFNIPIIGITGSNGKTMVKEWLYQLLSPTMDVCRSPRSYNSQIGVPLSVWLLNEHTQVGLFEAGISKPGEMAALRDIIQPTIGVITNLGAAHQENFTSMEEKCREKVSLFHDARQIVYPADDKVIAGEVEKIGADLIGWSTRDAAAPMYVSGIVKDGLNTKITYRWKGIQRDYVLPFIDEASIACSIAAAATALLLGVGADDLSARMKRLEPVAMRLEVKKGKRGCTLINDSYNSDINSLDIALDFMNRRPDQKGQRRALILSDIAQSGKEPEELYRDVAALIERRGVQRLIGIGPEILSASDCFANIADKQFFTTTAQFLASDTFRALSDELILIKGARQFGFDHITERLEEKVHETILEVDLSALVKNLDYYRSLMKSATKLICMIKADGYGAGAIEIAKTLQDHRVDYLAVAVADEGAALRLNGITQSVIVMNPEMTAFKTLFDYDLEPEVYSFRLLEALIKAAEREGVTRFPVHIKLDTGMNRLGFSPENDTDRLIDRLKHQNAVIPRSVFSHFAGSEDPAFDSFSRQQFERFDKASKRLQNAFRHKILRHICNSAAIERLPQYQLDMCRLGIGLYGPNPITNTIINNVSTLKSTILQIRRVKAGDTVGYSRKGTIDRDSMIAAIPIGYADGLNRHLGNRRGYCLVDGRKAPYVGNICMDVAMIDVTDIECREGDYVEIFGGGLHVTEVSDLLGTIPYEVLCSVSNRVKRVYYQE